MVVEVLFGDYDMKIAVSACGETLAAKTHSLFGRCDYFVIVDTETGESSSVKNTSADAATGAGTAAAQDLFNAGVKAVISGQIGPNAYKVLKAAGIAMYSAPAGISVQEALEKFKAGALPKNEVRRF
jgi:predicted Fe-Mo cluster-binding NifX family protein